MTRQLRRRISQLVSPAVLTVLRLRTRLTGQQRARVLVLDHKDNLMLVWETIGVGRWSVPGGGINKGETPAAAAARELYEETGIDVSPDSLEYLGFFQNARTEVGYDAYVFAVRVAREQLPTRPHNSLEIIDIKWFPGDALPSPLSPFVRLGLERLSMRPKI